VFFQHKNGVFNMQNQFNPQVVLEPLTTKDKEVGET